MSAQPSSAATGPVLAPVAPGRLGQAAGAAELAAYLGALAEWAARRKADLDRLDAASLRADDPDAYSADVTLSMALWQTVDERRAGLLKVWDGGRADAAGRERMSQLIWGRLDGPAAGGMAAGTGMSLSLVEACRLSDALVTQLSTRLAFDPSAAEAPVRVAALREAMERLHELVKVEPSWAPQVDLLRGRLDGIATRAARGLDVSDPLTTLEADAARCERDLIVTTASKRKAERDAVAEAQRLTADRARAAEHVAAAERRAAGVRVLVDRCVAEIARAPRLAVPAPSALGPVPDTRAELDDYLAKLSRVDRAMDVVERAYGAPLTERDELRERLAAYQVMAARSGRADDATLGQVLALATAALTAVPCDLEAASAAVDHYTRLARPAGTPGPTTPRSQ